MGAEGGRSRLGQAVDAFTSNARNPNLRRAQLSFLGAWTAEWAFTVALGIVAYRDGGAAALGLVGLLRMVPSAILAPLLSPIADRGRRERVLILVSIVRGVATAAAAVVVAVAGPPMVIYALAVLSTIAATLYRPAHSALLPSLCRTGYELASANMVRGLLDSTATLVGPLLAAVLLQFTGVEVVFAVAAAASFWAAALLVRLRYEAPPRPSAPSRPNLAKEAVEGVRAVTRNRDLMLILGLAAAQALTRGALTVLSVVVAIELLGTGEPGVGALMTAVGVGAVLGSLAASLLVGTGRLGAWFAVGIGLWGLPLTLIGLVPQESAALGLLAFIGVGNALVDLAGFTLIGRMAPDEVLARVFGVLESLVTVSIGIGAIVASTMVEWFGVQTALIAIGLVCPVLAVASWWRLRSLDRSVDVLDVDVGLLRRVPMFCTLPLPAVEQLARGLEPVAVAAGDVVFTQGDVGDRYYLIESGEADVVGYGRVVATLGPGEGFGEIALLRSTRRNATVVARGELRLRALGSDRFLSVVLGYTPSARQAAAVVDDRLDRYAERMSQPIGSLARITVVGDALIDELRDAAGSRDFVGGAALNVAVGLAVLGHRPTLVAMVGDDGPGETIRAFLAEHGVDLVASPSPHGTSRAVSDRTDGEPRYEFNQAAQERALQFDETTRAALDEADLIVVSCFPFDDQAQYRALVDAIALPAERVIVDGNPRSGMMHDRAAFLDNFLDFASRSIVAKIGDDDAELLLDAPLAAFVDRILAVGDPAVLATAGREGAAVHHRGLVVRAGIVPLDGPVIDTMGGGDATLAAITHEIATGGVPSSESEWQGALEHAMRIAAATVRAEGALLRVPGA